MRFSHTTYLYFRVFHFLQHREHTLNFTKKNLLYLSVAMNTLYSENRTELNADCHGTGGRSPAFSPRSSGFDTRSIHVGFMVDGFSLGQVSFRVV